MTIQLTDHGPNSRDAKSSAAAVETSPAGMNPPDAVAIGPDSHLCLIDGSGYIFRAYHALPGFSRPRDGLPLGAVFGFSAMLWKLLSDARDGDRPTHLAVILDHSGKTFRNDLYPLYKAHRPPAPEDLIPQFPLIRVAARAFGAPAIEKPGFEADDLIATYARAASEKGARVTIISSDKDLMQLVNDRVQLFDGMKNKPIRAPEVVEKFGVGPDRVVDVQALMGDSSDNVPGVPGIGQKTAASLILEFGDLDRLLAGAATIKQDKRRQSLIEFADQARLSRELVRLREDVPLDVPLEHLGVRPPDPATLRAFLDDMEFRSLARRVADRAGSPLQIADPAGMEDGDAPGGIDHSRYRMITEAADLRDFVARASAQGFVAFDTETDALSAHGAALVGFSLAIAPNEACYVPVGHRTTPRAPDGDLFGAGPDARALVPGQMDLAEALGIIGPVLQDDSVLKIGQNIKYDMGVMARHGIDISPIDDVMLISYALDVGRHNHGMDELSERHLGHRPIPFSAVTGSGKAQISFAEVGLPEATRYAAEDADVTLRLWQKLKLRLVAEGQLAVYERLERPMPSVLCAMERAGIRIDPELLTQLSASFSADMVRLEAEAHAVAGQVFNVGSPKQLGEILFDRMKLPGGKRTKTGAWSTDADMLEDLANAGHELPRILLQWRTVQKLKSTYTEALREAMDPVTRRVHTSFSLASTTTGRLSSSEPNLQNIPIRTKEGRRIREAFIAEPGAVLISADYSQIELRLLAHVANIPALREAFRNGLDIHAMTASEMFGVPVEGMPAETRRRAKAINFGIIYGISAFGLANQLSIPQGEARAYIAQYFERFPGIRRYMDETIAFARENGFVRSIFGRRMWIRDIGSKTPASRSFAERQAINAPLQGSAADIIRRAMARMPGALVHAGLSAKMLLQVHDELVFEAPEDEAEAVIAVAKRVMAEAPMPGLALEIPLVVEAHAARNWALAH